MDLEELAEWRTNLFDIDGDESTTGEVNSYSQNISNSSFQE
jgi:hypothetical protein